MTVGSKVRLKTGLLGNATGAKGVCFNDYGDGCQFIFENGNYDGFSTEEQSMFLLEDGFDPQLSTCNFRSVMRVSQDFDNHLFDKALNL